MVGVARALSRWEFRGYRKQDLAAMVTLDNLCFDPPFRFSREIMKQLAEPPDAVVVIATEDDELVGFGIADVDPDRDTQVGYVMTLDVHPDARRHGVARELLWRMEKAARDRGATEMLLHVWTENKPAIRLYASSGYQQHLREKGFYEEGVDAFLFAKQLK